MAEWISVEERLPSFDEARTNFGATEYLVLLVAWGKVYQGSAYAYRDGKCAFRLPHVCGDINEDVTDWMPLPDPPSKGVNHG